MPTLLTFDFTSDTDAGNNGIPVGGLYHNSGQLFMKNIMNMTKYILATFTGFF